MPGRWDSAIHEGALSLLNTAQDICWSWGLSAGKTPTNWTKLFYLPKPETCFFPADRITFSYQRAAMFPCPQCTYMCAPVYWPMGKVPRATERCVQWDCGGRGAGGGLLGAVFASNVPCGLLDGAFRNKGRVFSITRLQGLFQFLCCGGKGKKNESSVFRLNAAPGNPEQLKCSSTSEALWFF